ncbi:hypothetical protein [Kitasatospora sp. McL0602]|uniref:hypothetical protein n=1 Tax=Kitasatospora sp. McL0602 TaxID=3439530 RepID=UPI003F8CC01E
MRQIDLDNPATPARRPARPRLRRRLAFTLVGALAAGAAVAGVTLYDRLTNVPMNSSVLATWTVNPTHMDTSSGQGAKTLKWCLDGMPGTGEPTRITNADLRGKVTSMVINRGGTTVLCYVASGSGGFTMSVSDTGNPAHDAIAVDTGGSHGDGPDTFNYAAGFVGSDVKAISLTAHGRTFEVTVEGGRWTAWWPGSSGDRSDIIDSATLTLTDGTTRTVPRASLYSW